MRERQALDGEAECRELARRRVACPARRKPAKDEREHRGGTPPERTRLAVVDEDDDRARCETLADGRECSVAVGGHGPHADEGDDGGSGVAVRRGDARAERSTEARGAGCDDRDAARGAPEQREGTRRQGSGAHFRPIRFMNSPRVS